MREQSTYLRPSDRYQHVPQRLELFLGAYGVAKACSISSDAHSAPCGIQPEQVALLHPACPDFGNETSSTSASAVHVGSQRAHAVWILRVEAYCVLTVPVLKRKHSLLNDVSCILRAVESSSFSSAVDQFLTAA